MDALGKFKSTQKLELLSAAPRATLRQFSCSPNFPRASITRYTHVKHKQILKYSISNGFDTKRLSFIALSHGILQTSVQYLNLLLFVTHFTSITRRY